MDRCLRGAGQLCAVGRQGSIEACCCVCHRAAKPLARCYAARLSIVRHIKQFPQLLTLMVHTQ